MSLPIFTDMLAAASVTAEKRPRQTARSESLTTWRTVRFWSETPSIRPLPEPSLPAG
jgi:hypothetical protein